jgi:hypothetical protein
MLSDAKNPRWPARALLAASLTLSCGAALYRETTATNVRADDPWLEGGQRCAGNSQDDAGLHIEELEAGIGAAFGDGQEVRVHYVARLPDGKVVHDTRQGGDVSPPLASAQVVDIDASYRCLFAQYRRLFVEDRYHDVHDRSCLRNALRRLAESLCHSSQDL